MKNQLPDGTYWLYRIANQSGVLSEITTDNKVRLSDCTHVVDGVAMVEINGVNDTFFSIPFAHMGSFHLIEKFTVYSELTDELRNLVAAYYMQGATKIDCTKYLRNLTGWGLRKAKEMVETILHDINADKTMYLTRIALKHLEEGRAPNGMKRINQESNMTLVESRDFVNDVKFYRNKMHESLKGIEIVHPLEDLPYVFTVYAILDDRIEEAKHYLVIANKFNMQEASEIVDSIARTLLNSRVPPFASYVDVNETGQS